MRRPRPFYFLRRAATNLRGAPLPALVTSATIAIVLFLFGAFALTAQEATRAFERWAGEGQTLTVYARLGADDATLARIRRAIEARPEVSQARFLTPTQAFEELRLGLGEEAGVLEGIEPAETLPASFVVTVGSTAIDAVSARSLADFLRALEGVASVDSETAWLERFASVGRALRWVGAGWAAILGFGALLVIGNSTRLAALTRKEEIEVLRLVGASEGFVIMPFFLEGAIQGALGSVLALAALWGAYLGAERMLADDALLVTFREGFRFLDPRVIAGIAIAGPLLGAIGAVGSARRFLQRVAL